MYPAMQRGLAWLLTDMDGNGNMFPGGYGIMEVYGLNAEADRCRGVHPAGARRHGARRRSAWGGRRGGPLPAAGVGAGVAHRRAILDRGGRLLRRLLRDPGSGGERRGGSAEAAGVEGRGQADPERSGTDGPLHAAGADIRQDAGHHERLAHEQELGHRDAAGDGHRPAGRGPYDCWTGSAARTSAPTDRTCRPWNDWP